ncbi:hypothetical protein ABTL61_19670, partial [Acinetobacter baumannii]
MTLSLPPEEAPLKVGDVLEHLEVATVKRKFDDQRAREFRPIVQDASIGSGADEFAAQHGDT